MDKGGIDMKAQTKAVVRAIVIGHVFIWVFLFMGCASLKQAFEMPFTYYEFDGVYVYYKTQDTATYRELLPSEFEMPEEPLVMTFVMDYYKMDKATEPYKEVVVFLLVKYQQRLGWHCVTMPVTTDAARIGGIKYLGFPKIMGDVQFQREPANYSGGLMLNNKTVMTVQFEPYKDHKATRSEKEFFNKKTKLASFNLLNGKVYEPEFGPRANALTVSRIFPNKLVVKIGTANLTQDSEAAGAYSERLGKIFSIKPSEIVMAYYLKNSFKMSFGAGSYAN